MKTWPGIFATYECEGPILPKMPSKRMIMPIAKDMKPEITGVQYIDVIIKM